MKSTQDIARRLNERAEELTRRVTNAAAIAERVCRENSIAAADLGLSLRGIAQHMTDVAQRIVPTCWRWEVHETMQSAIFVIVDFDSERS